MRAANLRELGEPCGFGWCVTDHEKETKSRYGHHRDECWVWLPTGFCSCKPGVAPETKQAVTV